MLKLFLVLACSLLIFSRVTGTPHESCRVEEGYEYDDHMEGKNNATSLRICDDVREEKICVVGGGLSGVHISWLLKRRGFKNTVIFEKNDRIGGMINTYYDSSDGIIRELAAAFLSPDYYEVRSLLSRYSLSEVVVYLDMMQFHSFSAVDGNDTIYSPDVWYDKAVSLITGDNDTVANNALVDAALDKYLTLHSDIFGDYITRFPPKPTDSQKFHAIRGTFLEFLQRNQLEVLLPMFFQFFVMQGMGTLKGMPAYYGLKWVSPSSINSGGFGNDPNAPLGMLKDGFSTMVSALAKEAQLDIRLQQEVVSIDRAHAAENAGIVGVTTKSKDGTFDTHRCDLVVLTGPIPEFMATEHSDAVVDPTSFEKDLFEEKHAMQFMQSLVDMDMQVNVDSEEKKHDEQTKPVSPYKALDYWPTEFSSRGGVIVRRDVGYAETRLQHTIGGVQSFSYHPPPFGANQSEMWSKQKKWLERYGYGTEESGGYEVLGQFYIDTYMYHYEEKGIMEGKPWELENYQGLSSTRTLYVGGAVSFEAMEDVINFNLDLIRRKFDESDLFASFS